LHKDAKLGIGLPSPELVDTLRPRPISPRAAAMFAVQNLQERKVKDILVCESRWIAAPLGGYLVDCQGRMSIGGKRFTVFRVGIMDGTDSRHGMQYRAGTEFVFIALGRNAQGKNVWFPDPGPDYVPGPGEETTRGMLAYEFLLRREDFETLARRYRRTE
jgi:hypothetical protein